MTQINVTDQARNEIQRILPDNNAQFVRIIFQGAGWHGINFGITLDGLEEEDEQVTANGIDIIFNRHFQSFVNDCDVDYFDNGPKKGFSVSRR